MILARDWNQKVPIWYSERFRFLMDETLVCYCFYCSRR